MREFETLINKQRKRKQGNKKKKKREKKKRKNIKEIIMQYWKCENKFHLPIKSNLGIE